MIHSHCIKKSNRPDSLNVLVLKKKRIDRKVQMEFTAIITARKLSLGKGNFTPVYDSFCS